MKELASKIKKEVEKINTEKELKRQELINKVAKARGQNDVCIRGI